MPRYVEAYFIGAAREIGLRTEPRADGLWRIEHVLADLRSERLEAVRKLGKPDVAYRKIAFDKARLEEDTHVDAVLLGPGHALYATVDEKLNERLAALVGNISCYEDPLSPTAYVLHFFEIAIRSRDTKGKDVPLYGELVTVREEGGAFAVVPSDILLNLPPHPKPPGEIEPVNPQPAADFLKTTYQLECRARCQEERQQFARIIREYLEKSFDARIKKAQERAMLLAAEVSSKPEYKLPAEEARKQVDELQRSRNERLDGLKRLEIARTGPVRHVATAVVLPVATGETADLASLFGDRDPKTEIAAEDFVIDHLVTKEGFRREDCQRVGNVRFAGNKREGFDIRAVKLIDEVTGVMEVRRIEVKGRQRGGNIVLTTNEWYKAQQLAEHYWLYVVWDPLGQSPELVAIQNPAQKLDHAKREIIASRYYEIPADAFAITSPRSKTGVSAEP